MAEMAILDTRGPVAAAAQVGRDVPVAKRFEQALTLAAMGSYDQATKVLRDVTAGAPDHAPAWRKLAELLRYAGEDKQAVDAEATAADKQAAWSSAADPRSSSEIAAAEDSVREFMATLSDLGEQARELRERLRRDEVDVVAMRLLACLEASHGNQIVALDLFERAVSLAPDYEGVRVDYSQLLRKLGEPARAAAEAGHLISKDPANLLYRALYADALRDLGDLEHALPIIEQLVREQPKQGRFRAVYAQTLHFAGRREESVKEFRACLDVQHGMGEAYWGLAELRGNYLTETDIADIRAYLRTGNPDKPRAVLLHYALGRALEEHGNFEESFPAYATAASLARQVLIEQGNAYDPVEEAGKLQQYRVAYTPEILSRRGPSATAADVVTPIFIVGMPRAGSTLLEQILASHSLVEGTIELPVMGSLTRQLDFSRRIKTPHAYPECVRNLSTSELAELGTRYIEEAKAFRKTRLSYFVDKRPWNWFEVGLIHLILPHAKIIDVRREPMAACFALFKQSLASEPASYDFDDLAHYYTQYVDMMRYWDSVLPGRVHLLKYERLVENPETEIRRLLEYCGLPFEEKCLRFWETDRAVPTPSAEQVRRPMYRDAVEQWRKFEPWLDPLKQALQKAERYASAKPDPEAYERALSFAAMGLYSAALEELRNLVLQEGTHPGAWTKLSEMLRYAGEDNEAAEASAAALRLDSEASKWRANHDPRTVAELQRAQHDLVAGVANLPQTLKMEALREHLDHHPTDTAATHLLSRLEEEAGDKVTAQNLLCRTLELSPSFHAARAGLAGWLVRDFQFARALEQTTFLIKQFPHNAAYRAIHSDALRGVGDFEAAEAVAAELVREQPHHAVYWLGYGRLLRMMGKRDESAKAFRKCLERAPDMGEAYWALADLKSGVLTDADITAMRAQLADPALTPTSRMQMYYALGKALEDKGEYAASFTAYQQGARLFRGFFLTRGDAYNEHAHLEGIRSLKGVFTPDLLTKHAARPDTNGGLPTPIFVVGMPRAGSTLIEQILASHRLVEGTRELPLIGGIADDLNRSRRIKMPNAYPARVRELTGPQLSELGARYLEEARVYRKTDRPFFVDKRPWNWLDVGLIHLILPHAKIVDIRREPMAACFAMFKQVLMDGADFSYDLGDLGRYYRGYVELMEHWKGVLPGRVHFLQYERLVENTETEIRRLLDYCDLPFDESCLRFWETDRPVATPSSEQVRRPIFRDALQQWRNFEPWLGPLKAALAQPR